MFCCKRQAKKQINQNETSSTTTTTTHNQKNTTDKPQQPPGQLQKNITKVVQATGDLVESVPVVGKLSSKCLKCIAMILISIDASQKMPDFLRQCRSKLVHVQALLKDFESKKLVSSGITVDFFEELNTQLDVFRTFVEEKLQKQQSKSKVDGLMNLFSSSSDTALANNFKQRIDEALQKFLLAKIHDDIQDTFPEFLKNIYKSKPGYETWKELFGNKEQKKKESFIQRYSIHNELDKSIVVSMAEFIDKDKNGSISFEEYMAFIDDYIFCFDEKGSRIRKQDLLIQRLKQDSESSGKVIIFGDQITYPDGVIYKGEIQDGMRQGYGKMTKGSSYSYEGYFNRDLKQGQGIEIKNSTQYEGEWKNNQKNGKGKNTYKDGSTYEGTFVQDLPQGQGKFISDQDVYEGTFVDGYMIEGVIKYQNGERYEGQTKDTKYRHGRGRQYDASGQLIFEGNYQDNVPTQKYTYYSTNDQDTLNKYKSEITHLEINLDNYIDHDPKLLNKLRAIQILHIEFSITNVPHECKELALKFLSNVHPDLYQQLTELTLIISNEQMIKIELEDFHDIFKVIKKFTNITSLNLSLPFWGAGNPQVDGTIIDSVIETYQSFKNLQFITLNFHQWGYQNKSLKNEHVISVIKGLQVFDSSQIRILSLDLGRWGCDTYDSYLYLTDLTFSKMGDLIRSFTNLEKLNLNLRSWAYKNPKITDQGVDELFDGISKLSKLRTLEMGLRGLAYNNSVTQQALVNISKNLKKIKTLESINLILELCDNFNDLSPLYEALDSLPKLQNKEIED